MTGFDYAVLVIVGLSILISVIRGLVREVLALLAWLAAFATATLLGADVGAMMPEAIPTEELRLLTGFLIVFVGVLLDTVLTSGLVQIGVSPYWQGGVQGLIVVVAVSAAVLPQRRRNQVTK